MIKFIKIHEESFVKCKVLNKYSYFSIFNPQYEECAQGKMISEEDTRKVDLLPQGDLGLRMNRETKVQKELNKGQVHGLILKAT